MSSVQSELGATLEPEPQTESDEALVERIRGGDQACFAPLMRRYNQRLYRVARAITRHDADAEDAVQHAYLTAFSCLHQFAGTASFATWLTRIAINQAISRHRERRRRTALQRGVADHAASGWDSGADEQRTPEDQVGRGELARLLETAIDALPERYRAVVVLRELEGMSTQEAATCLSISEEAARVRLHRARGLLREELYGLVGAAHADVFTFGGARCARIVAWVLAALRTANAGNDEHPSCRA